MPIDTPSDRFVHETSVKVRFYELDPYDHVNHTNYFSYFETARIEYLTEMGWGLDVLKSEGFQLVVVEIRGAFLGRRPLRAGAHDPDLGRGSREGEIHLAPDHDPRRGRRGGANSRHGSLHRPGGQAETYTSRVHLPAPGSSLGIGFDDQRRDHAEHPVVALGVGEDVAVPGPLADSVGVDTSTL